MLKVITNTISQKKRISDLLSTFFIPVVPQVVIYPNNTEILAGATLIFACVGYGIPLPSIVWEKNGQRLSNDSRRESWQETVVLGNHTFQRSYLQLCGTVEGDSGDYGCRSVTEERESAVKFGIRIIGVPATLITIPEDVGIVAETGTSIVVTCIAIGSPTPEIKWMMLQRGIQSDIETNSSDVDGTIRVFSKQSVREGVGIVQSSLLLCPSHPGALTTNEIRCLTDNKVNGSNFLAHSFSVNVSGMERHSSISFPFLLFLLLDTVSYVVINMCFLCNLSTLAAPAILVRPVSHRGFITEQIVLSCTADGVPLPDIVWLKNGCPLSTHIAQSTRFTVTETVVDGFRVHVPEAKQSILTITNSKESDGGEYTCRARNKIDTAYLSTPHTVAVNGAYACLSSLKVLFA